MRTPKRIQRKRTKGWRMPKGAIYVGRPTPWGNPFAVGPEAGREARVWSLRRYREWLEEARADVNSLRGKNLACWCRLDQLCHADVLLELANRAPLNTAEGTS